jgi:hypothetical protein
VRREGEREIERGERNERGQEEGGNQTMETVTQSPAGADRERGERERREMREKKRERTKKEGEGEREREREREGIRPRRP